MHGDVSHRDGKPQKPHEDFRVEVHPLAHAHAPQALERRDGIDAKTAHGVLHSERKAVDGHPEVRDLASEKTRLRDRFVVDRIAADEAFRIVQGDAQKVRDFREVVLRVGVHLQDVREAAFGGRAKARETGRALAAVFRTVNHHDAAVGLRKGVEHRARFGVRAVVDEKDRKTEAAQGGRDLAHRFRVVVAGNDGGRAEGGLQIGRHVANRLRQSECEGYPVR